MAQHFFNKEGFNNEGLTDKGFNNKGLILLLFSFVGYAISYASAIVLARTLGPEGYNDYAVTIAAAAILVTLAKMGTGKFAMRTLPVYYQRHQWKLARGYVGFSLVVILLTSTVLGLLVAAGEGIEAHQFGSHAIGIVILFLPAMALLGFGVEFLIANDAVLRAAFVMRFVVPAVTLTTALVWIASAYELTVLRATYCYALGSVVGLVVVWILARRTTPQEFFSAAADYETRSWLLRALPFLYFGLLVSLFSKVGVLVLEWIHPEEAMVAIYSVAVDTGGFLYIVAKSTDKMYLPMMSLMIERRDVTGMLRARRHRRAVMGTICVVYLAIVFVFGKQILSVFGPKYVEGFPALCLITAATSVWTLFSLAPAFLKYNRKNTLVVSLTVAALIANVVLCLFLGQRFGATGAAVAYAAPVCLLYLAFAYLSNQTLAEMQKLPREDDVTLHDLDADEYTI